MPTGGVLLVLGILMVLNMYSYDFIPPLQAQTTPGWPGGPFTDSFEGTPPTGWDAAWSPGSSGGVPAGDAANLSGTQTGAFVTPPPGGGSNVLRQWAHDNVASGYKAAGMTYYFDTNLVEGDVLELEYYLYYDPKFNSGLENRVKTIILQSTSETDDRIYISSHGGSEGASVFLQLMPTYGEKNRFANTGGGNYDHPNGEWVQYRWQIKMSARNGAPNTGYIYGWVNGTQRFDYQNISTYNSGEIDRFFIQWTINQGSLGIDQKRYFDLFKVRVNPVNDVDPTPSPSPSPSPSPTPTPSSTTPPTFNTPPTITTPQSAYTVRLGDTLTFDVTAEDTDGDVISINIVNPQDFPGASWLPI